MQGRSQRWTHFPCGQWLAADQADGRIARTLTPRVIQVDHFDGMHDAAAQELVSPVLEPLPASEHPAVKHLGPDAEPLATSGDSCRSTQIKAVVGEHPRLKRPAWDDWTADCMREQPGKADIMHRYLEGVHQAEK